MHNTAQKYNRQNFEHNRLGLIMLQLIITCYIIQERRKVLRSGGAKGLDRINLYGKNPIPMEKL